MVVYDMMKALIPEVVDILFELTTASETDQNHIARDFVKRLAKKHRTSQQLLIKLLSKILHEYSNTNFDPRNQASVEWSKKVSELDNNFPYV